MTLTLSLVSMMKNSSLVLIQQYSFHYLLSASGFVISPKISPISAQAKDISDRTIKLEGTELAQFHSLTHSLD